MSRSWTAPTCAPRPWSTWPRPSTRSSRPYCVSEYAEEWDLEGLAHEIRTFWPTKLDADTLGSAEGTDGLYDTLMAEAVGVYEAREAEMGEDTMRKVEREVMLRIIDQKWREHLADMDYLRDGINLRAMGQKDPLNEWQREGFEMFGAMMSAIAQDFVRILMRIQVTSQEQQQQPRQEPALKDVQYSAPEDPVQGSAAMRGGGAPAGGVAAPAQPEAEAPPANVPVTKSDWDKTGRNEPCPCGSGKKYKLCHGR